jgi:hypothetical protein
MPLDPPLWRRTFDLVERGVGVPLEAAVRSDLYFDALAVATRVRKGAGAHVERLSRRGLHLLNLPAGSDMRRLNDQLARLDRRVLSLSKQLEAENGRAPVVEEA